MRRALATLLGLAAPACVLATDFDSFHGGAGGGGADTGSEAAVPVEASAGSTGEAGADGSVASRYAAAVEADVPYLHYRLGEAVGASTARDSSRRRRDATFRGKVTFGRPGALAGDGDTALRLDGDGAISIPGQAEFAGTTSFSIEAWVKPATILATDEGGHVIAATESGNNNGWALFYYRDRHPKLERESASEDDIATASVDSPAEGYTYLVGTYDGAKLRVYVNGKLAATESSTAPIPGGANVPFAIGGNDDGTSNTFQGDIDEVAVYDFTLTPAQISRHWAAAGNTP